MIKLTLFQRIFLYFIIIILISLVTTSVITYRQSSKEIDQYMINDMSQTISNALHHTNIYLEEYERILLSILGLANVQKFVSLAGDDYYGHYYSGADIKQFHFKNISDRNPDIASIYLLSNNGQYIIHYNQYRGLLTHEYAINPEESFQFLDNTIDQVGKAKVYDHSVIDTEVNQLITVSQRILSRSDVSEYAGIISIEFHKHALESLWNGIDLGEDGHFLVVNDSGHIIYHPNPSAIGMRLSSELRDYVINNRGEIMYDDTGDVERAILSRPTNYGNWHIVASMPLKELRKPIENIRTNTIVMSGIVLVIALSFVVRFGQSITGPIKTLKRGMIETEQGNWVHVPLTGRDDEMDDLTRRYNMMVTRLSKLVNRVYKAEVKEREIEVERQKAELHALQLQVNPHFLYNTLETISVYGMIKESDEIMNIVQHLAEMFRYAVRTDLEEVTVSDELNHVQNYIQIMNYRTDWGFEIDVVIPSKYLEHNIVRLTLQPLVENVFKHAFPDGLEKDHFIRIDANVSDGEFIVTVEDNGVGITEETLQKIYQKLRDSESGNVTSKNKEDGGIGLVNVHRRIQMVFGNEYGLDIESEINKGTKMNLRMPFQEE